MLEIMRGNITQKAWTSTLPWTVWSLYKELIDNHLDPSSSTGTAREDEPPESLIGRLGVGDSPHDCGFGDRADGDKSSVDSLCSLGGGANEDDPHEPSIGSLGSLVGGAGEDSPHESSFSSLGSLGGGAGEDDPHESLFSSLSSLGGGAFEDNPHESSFSSLGSLGGCAGEIDPRESLFGSLDSLGGDTDEHNPHESSFRSLDLGGGGADEKMLNSSFGSIGSLADGIGMEDQFRNPLSTFSKDGDNSKSFEKGRV